MMIAGAAAAVLLLGWLVYSRVEHSMLANSVSELEKQLADLEKENEHAKKLHASTADVSKWADDDVNWLDRIYLLEKSFPPAAEAVLSELTATSGQRGQISLKGRAHGREGVVHLAQGILAHGDKISEKSTRDDSSVAPYSVYFEVSVLPEKSEKP